MPSSTHSNTASAPNTSCDRPLRATPDPAGVQLADLGRRLVGRQLVAAVVFRLGGVLRRVLSLLMPRLASRAEQSAPQGGCVAEDADAEHHDDRRGQLGADAELVADVDDQRGNQAR